MAVRKKTGFVEFNCADLGGKISVNVSKILHVRPCSYTTDLTVIELNTSRKENQYLVNEPYDKVKEILG